MTKYTNGNEYVLLSNTEKDYIGNYNEGPDGNYYTGETYIYNESKRLEVKKHITEQNHLIVLYNKLNTNYSKQEFINLISEFPVPTDDDYDKKYIKRYFARKASDITSLIIEIDIKQFNKNNKYYNYLSLEWKIAGDNISEFNQKQIDNAKDSFSGIELVLINLTQLSIRKKDDII